MPAITSSSTSMRVTPPPVSHVSSVSKQASSSALPQDMWTSIFAFLPTSDLAAASCVNRSWRDWSKDDQVWEHRPSQDVRDNFAPLVKDGLLNWREAFLYTPLSHFASDIIVRRMTDSIRLQKNPGLRTSTYPHHAMPKPYVQYGNYSFAICGSTNIEMQEEGKPTLTLLPGEEGKTLTRLAVDGDFIFALSEDGTIVRWNYKTKKKLEDIHTDFETSRNSIPTFRFCKEFYVKDGYIIIISFAGHNNPDRTRLEIIPYGDPAKRQLINKDPSLDFELAFSKIILKGNQMIGKIGTSIWIRNLSNRETKIYDYTFLICDMNLDQHTLYVVDMRQRVYKMDLKSGNLTELYSLTDFGRENLLLDKIPTTVVNDLAFTFLPSKKLTVEDLRSGAEEILLEDQSQNIHDVAAYKANLLKKLIERVQRKPSSYPRLAKTFRSILKSGSFNFLRELGLFMIKAYCLGVIIAFIACLGFSLIKKLISRQ